MSVVEQLSNQLSKSRVALDNGAEPDAATSSPRIGLIGIDVDGTLLDSAGRIPPANLAAIAEASSRGIHIAIVTGRSFYFARPAVAALPDPLTLVVHNGAVTRTRAGDPLMQRLLPRERAAELLDLTNPWRESLAVIFDRPLARQMVYDRMDWTHPNRARFHQRNLAIIEQVARLEDAISDDPIQLAFNGGVTEMRELVAHLERSPLAPDISVMRTEYEARDFSLIDVCAAGVSKGSGLADLAALLKVPQQAVMAIGDNFNDREMLDWAGVGVVMGNASPGVHREGLMLTGSNDEAGLATAIQRFALEA